MNLYLSIIKSTVHAFPAVIPYLKGRARFIVKMDTLAKDLRGENAWAAHWHIDDESEPIDFPYKTYDYFLQQLERLVTSVYNGNIGGEFIDVTASLIQGQLTQAYEQAWADEGGEDALPDYLQNSLEEMILEQYDYVDSYYESIVDARVDETPIDPLLARATLWANRWNEAYNQAILLIKSNEGGNLEWQLGGTEEHCETCSALDGIVARASEWEELGVFPQSAPNDKLTCGGWKCDCSLTPTDKRRSPKAYESIMNAVTK